MKPYGLIKVAENNWYSDSLSVNLTLIAGLFKEAQ
jgi:hypothetical protein